MKNYVFRSMSSFYGLCPVFYVIGNSCVSPLLQLNTLKLALEGAEKERDFYFGKLREVELLCQEQGQEQGQDNGPFVERLMEVLYTADDQVSASSSLSANCIHSVLLYFQLNNLLWLF